MTKYEKLEAEYQQLSTPEQQWAWVLENKRDVKLELFRTIAQILFKNGGESIGYVEISDGISTLLLSLDVELI